MQVKLPMLIVMDTDAAAQFISSLVDNLELEVPYNWNGEPPTLKVNMNM